MLGIKPAESPDALKGKALELLGIQLPTDADALKRAYRLACRRLHTDISGTDATRLAFIEMKALYDKLVTLPWVFAGKLPDVLKTVTGQLLSELGQGLGPTVNGRDCEGCNGKGYTMERVTAGLTRCPDCLFGFTRTPKCRKCSGTGKFKQRSGRVGDCYSCNGTGFVTLKHEVQCTSCGGWGTVRNVTDKVLYCICATCKGTGEIEIFNPVIPKGRLYGAKR